MPKRAQLKPVKVDGRKNPWKIEVPARFSATGRRERFFFESKVDAENYAADRKTRLENFGIAASGALTPAQMEQAENAFALLNSFPVSLNQVVQDWIARRKAREATVSFAEAGEQFKASLEKRRIKGRPVSESYKKQVRQTIARFPRLHDRPLTDIDARMIAKECEPLTPSVKNACLAVLGALFSWSAEVPREWLKTNPARDVARASTAAGEVEVFTNRQVMRVLVSCIRNDEALLPYHLFGTFAGIRPEELQRMTWEHVELAERHIVLPPGVTKTRTRRVIEIEDTLAEWLEWWIGRNPNPVGLITPPSNLRKRLRAARDKAKVKWIQDGMRHTYASNWLAIHRDEHKLRANMGHRSADELWDHYNRARTKKEAQGFWAIRPHREKKVIRFQQNGAA